MALHGAQRSSNVAAIQHMKYDRRDICIAMKIVETEKGWH